MPESPAVTCGWGRVIPAIAVVRRRISDEGERSKSIRQLPERAAECAGLRRDRSIADGAEAVGSSACILAAPLRDSGIAGFGLRGRSLEQVTPASRQTNAFSSRLFRDDLNFLTGCIRRQGLRELGEMLINKAE